MEHIQMIDSSCFHAGFK